LPVLSSALRLISLFCIAAIVVSFAAFASDRAGDGSRETVARLDSDVGAGPGVTRRPAPELGEASPAPRVERLREREHGGLREAIDDVNDQLAGPFDGVVSGDIWTRRIVQGLLALLVFGVGIGFLGRYAAGRGV
jgi:hypothetical protein